MKRTTKEQKADALLEAARCWQNGELRGDRAWAASDYIRVAFGNDNGIVEHWPAEMDSCALSEVAGMGYDLLNADGTECEKTHKVDPDGGMLIITREDGTIYGEVNLRPVRR